ncbi:hypothetical protein ABIF69_004465 [Bradyrhizobium japonicum]
MSWHRVALMIRETVAGVTHVESTHNGVTLDFPEDGGRSDAGGFGVALNYGLLGEVDFLQSLCVDQKVLRHQTLARGLHAAWPGCPPSRY